MGKKAMSDYESVLTTELVLQLSCIYFIGTFLLQYKTDGNEFFLGVAISFAVFSISILLMSYGRQTGRYALFWPYFICVAFKIVAFMLFTSVSFVVWLIIIFFPSKVPKEEWTSLFFKTLFSTIAFIAITHLLIKYGVIVVLRLRTTLIAESKIRRINV